jgi:hypothetical protein
MISKSMLKLTVSCAAVVVVSSCGETTRVGGVGGAGGSTSSVTSVNIGLPDRGSLKSQVTDIETKMNAYRLVVKSTGGGCTDPTDIDSVDVYAANPSISASLQQGCDYEMFLELGNKGSSSSSGSSGSSEKVTYDGKVKTYLDTNCIQCHSASQSNISNLTSWATVKDYTSEIYDRVAVKADMPKGKTPSAADKELMAEWKNGGYLEKAASSSQPSSSSAGSLSAVYYKNNAAEVISKAQIQGQASLKVKIRLQLQQAGRDIGLGTATIQQPSTGGSTPPTTVTEPTPPARPFTLTGERNLGLVDNTGKSLNLNDLVKGKALIIDFSTTNCGYCIQEAQRLNGDNSLQSKFDGTKCSYVTVTASKSDLSSWMQRFTGTYTATHSYGLASGSIMNAINNIFGSGSPGTPTFMVINSDGTVSSNQWSNRLDEKILSACQ